ncbi:hypothetical protein PISL3812_01669 [Talaromyces islandicus]|uniref:Mid2 domain-containing protein n=1 Tax=Talaromyces islandicus TaxID=28573 RepID=A0A0U1LQ77_TALIS|nr:hypothetical protein PISL3812_01669 [Talaromyces islandicus]
MKWDSINQCVSTLPTTSAFFISDSLGEPISSVSTTADDGVEFNAYGISIRYQSTDFVSASATISSSSSPQSSLVPATFAPSNTTTSSTPEANHSSGLSSGAGVGIGVGVTIGIFALIGSGLFYYFRRRRSTPITYEAASVTTPTPPAPPSESHDKSELVGSLVYTEQDLDHIPRQEIVTPVQHPSRSESV